jgi:hypothetical protein
VGAGQHRHLGVLARARRVMASLNSSIAAAAPGARLAQHQRVGQIVDVLGGAGEVDELADRLQFGVAGDLLLEEIFHRLHVVIGGALDVLDPLGVGEGEVLDQAIEDVGGVFAQGRHFRDAGMRCQRLQPAHLDQHAVPDQAVLAENRPQVGGLVGVAAIDGGNRGQGCQVHGLSSQAANCRSTYCRIPPWR